MTSLEAPLASVPETTTMREGTQDAGFLAWCVRHPLLSLLGLAVLTRALLVLAAAAGAHALDPWAGGGAWDRGEPPWRYLARWDAAYYMGIAEAGQGAQAGSWAFEPAYPVAIRGLMQGAPSLDPVQAGVLVSAMALVACIPLMYHVTVAWFDRALAWRATALLLLLPSGFYLTVVYPESLFLALLLGFLLALHRRWWLAAGALASLAAVTRPQGVVLPAILAMAMFLERRRTGRVPVAALAALPLALALPAWDMLRARAATGDAFAAMHARQEVWTHVAWRWPTDFLLWPMTPVQKAASLLGATLLVASLAWAWRDARRRGHDAPLEAYALSALLAAVVLCYSDPAAVLRYLLPALSVPWALAAWCRTGARLVLAGALSFLLALAVAALFGGWYPLY